MEPESFKAEIERLRSLGWSCRWLAAPTELPPAIHARYRWLPGDYLEFVRGLEECVSADETRWILSPSNFGADTNLAFRHDEWEQIGLDAAEGDEELIREIRNFWDVHLPIFFDVGDGYAFHAIRVGDRSGVVVAGREPEFEESAEEVAASFAEFLSRLA